MQRVAGDRYRGDNAPVPRPPLTGTLSKGKEACDHSKVGGHYQPRTPANLEESSVRCRPRVLDRRRIGVMEGGVD
ncbi:hypothetical protein EVAR_95984_1 [Eumeta japonica]|uniref:Uncharacterized protein n=1 Tax=Eumeta variegata TaxID=151549 RepID=A0A4C1V851_EUMVA|nr:hypothetical protein EVAR_95984_1 [Eumeta japonica]